MTDTEEIMKQAKPYAYREFPRSTPLPPDVREGIGTKALQGLVLVWARSALSAALTLETLHLGPVKSRNLEPAQGLDVRIIERAKDWPAGTVLATIATITYGDAVVVEITDPPEDRDDLLRTVTPVGMFRTGVTLFELNQPVATDWMVAAAVIATRDRYTYLHKDSVRAVIEAALRAGTQA